MFLLKYRILCTYYYECTVISSYKPVSAGNYGVKWNERRYSEWRTGQFAPEPARLEQCERPLSRFGYKYSCLYYNFVELQTILCYIGFKVIFTVQFVRIRQRAGWAPAYERKGETFYENKYFSPDFFCCLRTVHRVQFPQPSCCCTNFQFPAGWSCCFAKRRCKLGCKHTRWFLLCKYKSPKRWFL